VSNTDRSKIARNATHAQVFRRFHNQASKSAGGRTKIFSACVGCPTDHQDWRMIFEIITLVNPANDKNWFWLQRKRKSR
jgi:hypothetical protein